MMLTGTEGAFVSGGVYVTSMASVPWFPAGSVAVTVIWLGPSTNGTVADHEMVPDAEPLWLFALFAHVTDETLQLSDAVPARATDEELVPYDGSEVGAVMVTEGAWCSGV